MSTSSLVVVAFSLAMAHTKNTARKQSQGLPKARFPRVATGSEERDSFYCLTLQLPPHEEEDWTSLTPSGLTSPILERAVNRLNEEHLKATDDIHQVVELVADLHEHPPTSSDAAKLPTPDQSVDQAMEVSEEAVSSTMEPPPQAVVAETVAETQYPPILLARRATAMPKKSQPAPPTAATKCPRPQFRAQREEVNRRRKPNVKPVSALQDIRRYQAEVKSICLLCG